MHQTFICINVLPKKIWRASILYCIVESSKVKRCKLWIWGRYVIYYGFVVQVLYEVHLDVDWTMEAYKTYEHVCFEVN